MKRILFFVGLFILIAGTTFGQCPGGRCCSGGQCQTRTRFFYPTFGGWWYYEQPIEAETVTPETITQEEEKQLEEPATDAEETPVPTFRERALTRINAFRAAAGLPPLELDENLSGACDLHCWVMASRGFGHDPAGGMEVIAYGVGTPEGAVSMWERSSSHAAILRARGAKVGIGRWGNFWTVRVR